MALLNEVDATAAGAALGTWLAAQMPEASEVAVTDVTIPHSAGMSMTTVLFTAAWTQNGTVETQRLVARVAPAKPGVFKDPDLDKEYRLLSALCTTQVPVPRPRWLELDVSILGAPFMVVEHVDGQVPGDDPPYTVGGWVMDLPPVGRARLFEGILQEIARIHTLDWKELGLLAVLDEPQFGAPGPAQQLAHWKDSYEWAARDGARSPTIDEAFRWAEGNRPSDGELVLNWGDARPGNVIYGEDLSVRAVLDWEMASIGSPQADVGWMAFIMRYMTEGIGAPQPEGMPGREQMVARYREITGRETPDVHFYEVLAAIKLSVIYVRVGSLMIAAGNLPAESTIAINNPCSQILARLLGLPAPAGEMVNYVGNR